MVMTPYYPPQDKIYSITNPQGGMYWSPPQGVRAAPVVVVIKPVVRRIFRLDYGRLDIDYLG